MNRRDVVAQVIRLLANDESKWRTRTKWICLLRVAQGSRQKRPYVSQLSSPWQLCMPLERTLRSLPPKHVQAGSIEALLWLNLYRTQHKQVVDYSLLVHSNDYHHQSITLNTILFVYLCSLCCLPGCKTFRSFPIDAIYLFICQENGGFHSMYNNNSLLLLKGLPQVLINTNHKLSPSFHILWKIWMSFNIISFHFLIPTSKKVWKSKITGFIVCYERLQKSLVTQSYRIQYSIWSQSSKLFKEDHENS